MDFYIHPFIANYRGSLVRLCVPDAPLDKGNPMASNIQPYTQPANHQAHVDSAGAHL